MAPLKTSKLNNLEKAAVDALKMWNVSASEPWSFGTNWTNVSTQFETFVNKFLFPKINETVLINIDLGNRFDWLAKEVDFVGQYSEEYVIMDTVPVALNLSKAEELMLKRHYPQMATKLYAEGIVKKVKFTLNDNDARLNFSTLQDAISYAMAVYKKRISDINVLEETEIKGMLVDYALNQVDGAQQKKTVTSMDELARQTYLSLLNIQNNSSKYNECAKASNGQIGRYTTRTKLQDVCILTTDDVKEFMLNTNIANTFQVAGLDPTNRIISFDDLGGVYRATADITLTATEVNFMKTFGDYQVAVGDIIPEGSVLTYDVSGVGAFVDTVEEIKPSSELFAFIFDINALRYRRNTKGMLKQPFYNAEYDEYTYWLHWYSFKAVSPFFNKIVITEDTGA